MNKPDYITKNDWFLLVEKYSNNMSYLKEKLDENYPIQYLIGHVDFCGYKILVDERVLIPRFETEELVAKTIKHIQELNLDKSNILDIGTGSGCIAIALAKAFPNAKITAIDISSSALMLAKENAKLNNVEIVFKQLDILTEDIPKNFDIIISNPPYVDINEPVDNSIKHEPSNAIFVSPSTKFYEIILAKANHNTKLIALEIGISQVFDLKIFSGKYFPENKVAVDKDLTGRERFIFILEN